MCPITEEETPEVGGGGSRRGPIPREDILYLPVVTHRDGVGLCITFEREVYPGAGVGPRALEAELRTLRLMGTYDVCPGVTLPTPSAEAVARQVVEEFMPAPPNPSIAPGYAITGRPAYLETKGNLKPAPDTRDTVLGSIEVAFSGHYEIDWGDGTPVERRDVEGLPWPEGRITHTYTTIGTYDVVVTAVWTADWRIGTTTGRITGLASSAVIDDFEVRQLQAVRDR